MSKPLVMLGSGGHAAVLADLLSSQHRELFALISPDKIFPREIFQGIPVYDSDKAVIDHFDKDLVKLVNGVGSLPNSNSRRLIFEHFTALGYEFETIVATDSIVSNYCTLAPGVQIMSGAIVQYGAHIGANSIINTGAIVDHDCNIGSHNHLAPGTVLSGHVTSDESVHFGTGSSIIHSIHIAKHVIIGAGCIVRKDMSENTVCYPAKMIERYGK